jgi:hypothetical protein
MIVMGKTKKRFTFSKGGSVFSKGTRIITDTETGVQYLFVYYPNYAAGGLTLLVDKDGKPLIEKDKE